MGVYIKGIEMPTDCIFCPMFHGAWTMCSVLNKTTGVRGRPDDCPLVPVPPHGRLIDADALTETMDGIWDCNDLYFQPNDRICDPVDCKGCKWRETMDCCKRMVKHAPTIIPAEEGE